MRLKKIITVFSCFALFVTAVPTTATESKYSFTEEYEKYKSIPTIDIYDNGCVVDNGVLIDYIGTEPEAVVPDGVVTIKQVKVNDNDWGNLESIVVPESVQEIKDWTFSNSNLKKVSIPETTKIGYMTFYGCDDLTDEQGLVIVNGVLHYVSPYIYDSTSKSYKTNSHIEVPEGVTEIRNTMDDSNKYKISEVRLPSTLKEISSCAFKGVNEVYFNDGIEFIPDFAFDGASSIYRFPKTLKHMGDFKWKNPHETVLELGDDLEYIGNEFMVALHIQSNVTFEELKLSVKGPAGSYIEAHCKNPEFAQYIQFEPMGESDNSNGEAYLTKKSEAPIDNPEDDNYEFIGNRLVGYHNITDTLKKYPSTGRSKTLYLPDETEIVGNYAFASNNYFGCSVYLPENVNTIEKRAFSSSKIYKVHWNSGLKTIGERSFYTSGLKEAELPDGLETIGDGAFEYSKSLLKVNIPETVSSIGKDAFRDCSLLYKITVPEETNVGESTFKGCTNLADKNGLVIVNDILYDAAKCTDRHITVPKNIKSISTDAFRGVTAKYIYVPEEISEISSNAFSENSVLFGQQNSAIQKYAKENNLPFYKVEEENFNDIAELIENGVNTPYGDLNSDGCIDLDDTKTLLKYVLKIKYNEIINYEKIDVNQDGKVDLDDVKTDLKTALKIEKEIYPEHVPQIIPKYTP